MGDDITIGVTEIVNNIEVTAQPNDQIVDISVTDNADNVTLNITPTVIEINVNKGSSYAKWGAITGTLSSQTDLQNALNAKFNNPTGNTTQYIAGDGSLITFPIAGQSGTLVREVRNTTGATLTKGTVVYINGANGNKPTVAKAIATGDSTSAQTFGIIQADLANNANGYVVCVGDIIGLDTSAITEGTQLYLSSTTAGAYTSTKQLAPAHLVYIGVVTRSHPTQGQIEVKIQNGYELDEIHDVAISSKANNQFLVYESATDLWKNKSLGTVLGYTPANDASVVKVTTDQNIRGIKTFLGDQTATTLKLIVADYYNDGFITSDNGMLRLLNGTTELFNLASTGDLTAKSFVKSGGTASQFLKANGTVDSTTYLSGTVAIANGGTGATTASTARTNLGATTIGSGLFTLPNAGLTSFLRVNADNTVELLGADLFRTSIGAGTGNGTVTSVSGTGSYGGLTLTGTVTGSGDLTLGGTPTGTWPISVSGNAASVNTVQVSTNADFYLTFADANNGSPTSEFLYTIGSVKVNPSTGALTAGSFVKSGGTSSQYLMADGSVSTGGNYLPLSGGTMTGAITLVNGAVGIVVGDDATISDRNVANTLYIAGVQNTDRGYINFSDTANNVLGAINGGALTWRGDAVMTTSNISGTTNYIPKFTGSSAIGNSLIYDNGTNVGIGTTSPSALLDVNGTGRFSGNTSVGTINLFSNGIIRQDVSGTTFTQYWYSGSSLGTINTDGANISYNATNAFTLGAGGSERMRITSGGDVAIGTATPLLTNSNRGSVTINGSLSSILTLGIAGSYSGYLYSDSTKLELSSATQPLTIVTNGSERMRITSGGNVGIGTTSPGTASANTILGFVNGSNIQVRTSVPQIAISSNIDGDWYAPTYKTSNFASQIFIDGNGGTIGIRTAASGTAGGAITWNNGLRMDSSGNVGIGTTSPSTLFHIYKASFPILTIQSSSYQSSLGIDTTSGNLVLNNESNAPLSFNTNATERMRITSGGNVLIGTTTDAGYKLDVNGTGRFLDNLTVNKEGGIIGIDASNNPRIGFVKKSGEQPFLAFASDPFLLKVSSGSEIFASNTFTTVLSIATSGAATFSNTVTATGFFNSSDNRLKDLIDYDYNISDIKPITYLWKDGRDDKKHVGYSAQEVQKVMPDAVNEDTDGMLSVNYIEVLVAKIAELENRIKQLEK